MISFGKIKISIADEVIYEVDILAKNNVRKKTVKDYIEELSKEFFKNNLEIWINRKNIN